MKVIHCFLNGPYLGGAERSFILQAADVRDKFGHDVRFFVPFLDSPGENVDLISFLKSNGFGSMKIHHFSFDKRLFSVTRSNSFVFLLFLPLTLYGFFKTASNIHKTGAADSEDWWVGGNKIGFVAFFLATITSFRGAFLWHFRDYPFLGGVYRFAWKVLSTVKAFDLCLVGNSYSVENSLKKLVDGSNVKTACLYNPVGKLEFALKDEGSPISIGTASMFAPWKGIHSLVLFAALYEEELKRVGVSEFVIFGDEIYKTKGVHVGYKDSLLKLKDKVLQDSSFIRFAGLKKPEDIFTELDVFIHSSLKPEPFGRVLVESYHSATSLISTGLGGAGELIEDSKSGHVFKPYNYEGLFSKIKLAIGDNRNYFLEQGRLKSVEVDKQYIEQLGSLFG